MKILFVNHFPLTGSASGVYTLNLAKSLVAKGHKCAIVFPENKLDYEKYDDIDLYPVFFKNNERIDDQLDFNFPCFSTHPRSTFNFIDMNRNQRTEYQEAFYKRINEAIYHFQPDIIHSQHVWTLSGISSILAEINKMPLVITCHGTDIIGLNNEREKDINWGTEFAKQAYEYASSIITISEDNKRLLEEEFEINNKVKLIRNGINTKVFYKDDSIKREDVLREFGINSDYKHIISFVGKLTEIKGLDTLLDALSVYEDEEPLLLVAGDGELREELEKYADKIGLGNVVFLGNLPQDQLQKIYNIVDCSIVPSRKEAFGLVAVEALACGSPVIASKVGGLTEIVTEDVGLLFDMDDYTTLSKDINLILSGEKVFDHNKLANKIKKEYSQEKNIPDIEDIYNEAINKKAKTK